MILYSLCDSVANPTRTVVMDVELYQILLIAVVAMFASFIQSTTGFGFGIFAMMFFPYLISFKEANMISTILGAFTSFMVIITFFRNIHWKNVIFPLAGSVVSLYLAVSFVSGQANSTLTLLLGIALLVLSIYFFFFSSKLHIRITWYTGLIAGILSGLMNGLFSMGGPPVVIYFLQSEKDSDTYLATLSAFFVLSNLNSIIAKSISGFFTVNVAVCVLVGAIGMLIGSLLGKKVFRKLNAQVLRKVVYGFMAISGVINIVSVVL